MNARLWILTSILLRFNTTQLQLGEKMRVRECKRAPARGTHVWHVCVYVCVWSAVNVLPMAVCMSLAWGELERALHIRSVSYCFFAVAISGDLGAFKHRSTYILYPEERLFKLYSDNLSIRKGCFIITQGVRAAPNDGDQLDLTIYMKMAKMLENRPTYGGVKMFGSTGVRWFNHFLCKLFKVKTTSVFPVL